MSSTTLSRTDALGQVQAVLAKVKAYVEEHDTLGDIAELNAKYVPAQLQDEITWLADMAGRLLDADPADDSDDAVTVPPVAAN